MINVSSVPLKHQIKVKFNLKIISRGHVYLNRNLHNKESGRALYGLTYILQLDYRF